MSDHHGARVAQELAFRLGEAMREQGLTALGLERSSGVSRLTVANVLAGKVWPDLLTIANLERALGVDLWPGRHVPQPRPEDRSNASEEVSKEVR